MWKLTIGFTWRIVLTVVIVLATFMVSHYVFALTNFPNDFAFVGGWALYLCTYFVALLDILWIWYRFWKKCEKEMETSK